MFGKKNPNSPSPERDSSGDSAPEGQAAYTPIDDIADFADIEGDAPAKPGDAPAGLRAELDEANDRWRRAMADYQNYQRRALQNEQEAKRQGAMAVLHSLVPVLDHFDLALAQKPADASAASILEGVKVIRAEVIKALEAHGVRLINPEPNAEFDPNKHAALTRQPAEGVESGRISTVFQPGYELYDRVIRAAQVAVAP